MGGGGGGCTIEIGEGGSVVWYHRDVTKDRNLSKRLFQI